MPIQTKPFIKKNKKPATPTRFNHTMTDWVRGFVFIIACFKGN